MMTSKNHSNYNIKLIDFGISVIHDPNEKLSQKLGSVLFEISINKKFLKNEAIVCCTRSFGWKLR